ncbi:MULTISPECIES: flagellar hook-associated protein FlgL [Aneurinibacillus]|jgi:flagellar hook-associated protein 3 FlgL|uniref:Flagellar hook-associated protein 3 n=1 Tax=Aneurinibacillus danicus TaxID=267746 RepID=A0A511VBW1_9BACL|nr:MULTISPECIES: flagellar hook-associated protein FlgL [Aneurinibacillus]GEN35043.1 flagellar hook-associated protein 3 [Aneurinibacillus danicus]
MTFARVTQNMLNNKMLHNLNKSLVRMERYQEMLSTGRKVNRPSDDPVAAIRSMLYRINIAENKQFRENTDEAINWLTQSESSVSEGVNILTRVKELLTQAANDTNSEGEREKIADEIKKLRDQLGAVANTTYVGKYIFNGEKTSIPPYDEASQDLKPASDLSFAEIQLEVSTGIKIPINVDASKIFINDDPNNDGDTSDSTTVFKALKDAIAHLEANDDANIRNDLKVIQGHIENFLTEQASIGARVNRIELIQNRLDTQNYGNEKMLSDNEDADLAQVIMDLQNNENIHRAALAAGSRIIQPTLLDFLR